MERAQSKVYNEINEFSFMKESFRNYIVLACFFAVFVLVVAKGVTHAQLGDENIYYYAGKLISEGKAPYRDFFHAHPPLQIYILSVLYKAFGFNIIAFKILPLVSTLVSAFFIFRICQIRFDKLTAILSAALFLFSYTIMFNSVLGFGVEIATMFLTIGIFLYFSDKKAYAGIFFGLAASTRLLALIPIFAVFLYSFFSEKKGFYRLIVSFFSIFLIINLLFILIAGKAYIFDVYKYHLMKTPSNEEKFSEYWNTLKLNWIVSVSFLAFAFAKDRKKAILFFLAPVFYLIFLLSLRKIFAYYFFVIMPFAAIVGAYSLAGIIKRIRADFVRKIIVAIIIGIFAWDLSSNIIFLQKEGFAGISRLQTMKEFVLEKTGKDAKIFGDDSIVPLLALETKRQIAFDIVDTNPQAFSSGLVKIEEVLEKIRKNGALFVVRNKQGISSIREVQNFLNTKCGFVSSFHDKKEGDFLFYSC